MIKILFLAANPLDTVLLRIDEEMRAIDAALQQGKYRDQFEIRSHGAVRIGDLQELLLRHRPDIVHFSGHGSDANEIILQDTNSNAVFVAPEALSNLFRLLKDNIRCVVLNACYSEAQAAGIAEHIDCVVGMSDSITDVAARAFATSFYRAIGYGRSIQTAFELGCSQIDLGNLDEADVPKLVTPLVNPKELFLIAEPSSMEGDFAQDPVDSDVEDKIPACPYPGMKPFSEEQSSKFYGRSRETEAILQRLRHTNFLAVIGPSGSGKSSLVYAGCVPSLPKSRHFGQTAWNILSMRPGGTPDSTLTHLLQKEQYLESVKSECNTLVIIDQFEEAFTQPEPASSDKFLDNLAELVKQQSTFVILTVRADFYQNLMESPLWPQIRANQFPILPLRGDALREAIVSPAQDVGIELSGELVIQLLNDADNEPGALPFVQETLVLLWDKIKDGTLSLHAYQNLVNSYESQDGKSYKGIQIAMAERAEQVYQGLSQPQQNVARQIFLSLVQFVPGRSDVRRQQSVAQLHIDSIKTDLFKATLDVLTQSRLLTMSGVVDSDERYVDIAHEWLIQGWPTFQRWISAHRRDEEVRRRIMEKAKYWNGSPESIDHSEEMPEMIRWATEHLYALNTREHHYLTAVAIVDGPKQLHNWLSVLPDDIRKQQIQEISEHIFDQRPAVSEIVRRTLISTAKFEHSQAATTEAPTLDSEIVATFWPEFEQGGQKKSIASTVMWSFRSALTPTELLSVGPFAFLFWFRQNLASIVVALLVLLVTSLVWAGARWTIEQRLGVWYQETSVNAGFISAATQLPQNPEQIFVVTERGVGRDDGAALFSHHTNSDSWDVVTNNLTPRPLPTILALPHQDAIRYYISVIGRGILRSDDGQRWQVINQGLRSYVISSLVADVDDPQILFAGSGDSRGVYFTDDGGDSWSDITPDDLVGTSVTEMIFTHANDGLLLVGTEHGQVYSYDTNGVWAPRAIYPGSGNVSAFALEPVDGMTIYAGTASGKISRSFDGGLTWDYPTEFPTIFQIQSLVVVPGQAAHLFMSAFGIGGYVVWESIDAGDSWQPIDASSFTRETVSLLIPRSELNTIYAYGLAGLFESDNLGRSWRHLDLGAPFATVNHIFADPHVSDSLYLTYGGSLFKRAPETNGHWLRSNTLPLQWLNDVMQHPSVSGLVFATGYVPGEWSIFVSEDNGHSWSPTGQVLGHDAAFFNHTGSLELALVNGNETIYAGTDGCGVIWSDDRGETWQAESQRDCILPLDSPRNIRDIDVAPSPRGTLFVTADQTRVYRSDDHGRTWTYSELPLTDELIELEINQTDPLRLYAIAGADGFWRSTDGGKNWEDLTGPLIDEYIVQIEAVPSGDGVLYVVTRSGTLWKTTNGGDSWFEMAGNPALGSPISLAYDSQSDSLLVGTASRGLYRFQQWPFWQDVQSFIRRQ